MNIANKKKRTPLGETLYAKEEWQRIKIKTRLLSLGFSEGNWRGMIERIDAHRLPTFVRDVIVDELPDTAVLFNHPKLQPIS